MHIRMCLFYLVQQHNAIGLTSYCLGQDAAFAVADVAGRRAFERGDGVRLLLFAHVDGDDILLTTIERLSERQRRFSLAHAGGPHQHEHPNGLVGVVELGA